VQIDLNLFWVHRKWVFIAFFFSHGKDVFAIEEWANSILVTDTSLMENATKFPDYFQQPQI